MARIKHDRMCERGEPGVLCACQGRAAIREAAAEAREIRFNKQQDLMKELERIMPARKSGRWHDAYDCRICGSIVHDRVVHLRWHRGSEMLDVLVRLFGRP